MKEILNHLFEHKTLSNAEAKQVLTEIASEKYNPSQVVAFMTAYCMRSITVEELEGFRDALLEMCVPVDLQTGPTIDVCGTGGDGKDTFNISTLSTFVVAGAGYHVAKHGNYGVSSGCGSSNVMEALGYRFHNDRDQLKRDMDTAGVCFLHAPLFNPAMKAVAVLRKELAVKTFFNMLGPMVNPARPSHQFVGVFSLELARLYNYLYQKTDKRFIIVHGLEVYDEISLTGPFKIYASDQERIVQVKELGFDVLKLEDIAAGESIAASAKIFTTVLEQTATAAQMSVVLANAAMAIQCLEPTLSYEECKDKATVALYSGKALQSFKNLLNTQK